MSLYEYYFVNRGADAREDPSMYTEHTFSFDRIYSEESTQSEVYENTARDSVMSVLEGYNSTILAYGQTGTGKTYTMEGFKYARDEPQRGIVPRSMEEVFKFIEGCESHDVYFYCLNHLDQVHG